MKQFSAGNFKQFYTVLKFELQNYFKNKSFVVGTVIFVMAVGVFMFAPRILSQFNIDLGALLNNANRYARKKESIYIHENRDTSKLPIMLITSDAPESDECAREAFSAEFRDYNVVATHDTLDNIKAQVMSEHAQCAFAVRGLTSYTYYVKSETIFDKKTEIADDAMKRFAQMYAMARSGMSSEQIKAVMSSSIEHTTEALKYSADKMRAELRGTLFAVLVGLLLFFSAFSYGQTIVTNVAVEKGTRVMEVLVTSVRPRNMIFGKVVAAFITISVQLFFAGITLVVCYHLNKEWWQAYPFVAAVFDTPPGIVACAVAFFLLGFLMYSFLFGMFGSFVSKVENIDSSTALGVGSMLSIFNLIFVMVVARIGDFQSMPAVIGSFIPFSSPSTMFLRIATDSVPFYQVIISVVLLVASLIVIGSLAARIYRAGILLTGVKPTLRAVLQIMREADKKV